MRAREDLAWLAGLFEGEGCIRAGKGRRPASIRLAVAMTDEDVVRQACATAGVGKVRPKAEPRQPHYKPMFVWAVERSDEAIDLLIDLEPWFGERRRAKVREAVTLWLHAGSAKWLPYRLQPCGTYGAWQRHKKRGETPCEPCADAQRAWARENKRRQKARKAA